MFQTMLQNMLQLSFNCASNMLQLCFKVASYYDSFCHIKYICKSDNIMNAFKDIWNTLQIFKHIITGKIWVVLLLILYQKRPKRMVHGLGPSVRC